MSKKCKCQSHHRLANFYIQTVVERIKDTHGENCVLLNSLQEWLLGYF